MITVKSECMTNEPCTEYFGYSRFSGSAFNQMLGGLPGLPITLNFDKDNIIGKVKTAINDNGKIIVIGEIKEEYLDEGAYIVPGFKVNKMHEKESNYFIYDDIEPVCCGLTTSPKEIQKLNPMRKIGA